MITYTLEITVNDVSGVEKAKTFSDTKQLVAGVSVGSKTKELILTRPSRSVLGWSVMYSMRSPPDIHSEISWSGVEVIPMRETMFSCFKRFHTTASW